MRYSAKLQILHILLLAVVAGLWGDLGALAQTPSSANRQEDDQRDRFAYINAVRFTKTQAEIVDTAKMEAVKRIYNQWRTGGASADTPMDAAVMRQMYQAGDFKTLKTLIENGDIARQHSLDMADHRIVMILDVLSDICQKNGWRIYRSDSGNQSAGMKSDIDQTIYVYKQDEQGRWVRAEADDAKLVSEFNRQFPSATGLSLEALDIATIAGQDKFPDPRRTAVTLDAEGLRPFQLHAKDTMASLRATPGAYTYCGAVVQQMQLRAMEAIEKQLRIDPTQPGHQAGARQSRIPKLVELLGTNGLNNLVLMELGPTADDPQWKPREVSQERAINVMFDSLKPELVKGHAYDAAVANYLEFMHHLHDKHPSTKYHLRALDNGIHVLRQLEGKTGKIEYESLKTEAARLAHLEALLGRDLGGTHILKSWKTAFDVSVALRQAHKKGNLTDEDYKHALQPIAQELAGADWEKHLDLARKEYDRRCQEFMLHNIIATSTDRVLDWVTLDPDDPSKRPDIFKSVDELRLRHAMGLRGKEHDAAWEKVKGDVFKNHADIARLQLLYSFHEMRPDVVDRIVELAKQRGVRGPQLQRLNGLAAEAKSKLFKVWRFAEYPQLYSRYYAAIAQHKIGEYTKGVKHYILIQAGVIDTDAGRQPRVLGFDDPLFRLTQKNKTASIASRYARNAIFDVGNIDGAIQVLRVWSESGGDPDAIREVVIRESISALPLIGQVYIVAQSGDAAEAAYTGTIMIVCMVVPQAGIAAMVLSVGEAGVSLYEHEVSKPLNDTIADAIYRGYVGPSLYSFDKEPPQFTAEDAAALKSAQEAAEQLKDAQDKAAQEQLARHLVIAKKLRNKQANWEAHQAEKRRRETYEGSALLGTGAQLRQRRLDSPTLLSDVEPMIFYAASLDGPVDFTLKPLDPKQRQRLDDLRKVIPVELNRGEDEATTIDPVKLEALKSELAELEAHHDAHQRAQRYLNRALTNHELMHRIQRDSLWPWLAHHTKRRDVLDARAYVKTWCQQHRGSVTDALKALEVSDSDQIPDAAVEELGLRLLDDLTRSRQLWQAREYMLQQERNADAERLERSQRMMAGQALLNAAVSPPAALLSDDARNALQAAGITPADALSLAPVASAILERHVPDAPPEIQVSFRKIALGQTVDEDPDKAPREFAYRPDVKVTANPEIYHPPYSFKTFLLEPQKAERAASARSFEGLPLADDAVASLREYARQAQNASPSSGSAGAAAETVSPAVLTFVFCHDMAIPDRVVPETAALLPRLEKYQIPGEKEQGYLFGSTVLTPAPPARRVEILASGPTSKSAANHGYTDVVSGDGVYDSVWPGTWVRFRARDAANLRPSGNWGDWIGREGMIHEFSSLVFQRQIADSPDGPWRNIGPETSVRARAETDPAKPGQHPRLTTSWHLWKDPENDDEFLMWGGGGVEAEQPSQPKGIGAVIRLGGINWDENEHYRAGYFRILQKSQATHVVAAKLTSVLPLLHAAGQSPQQIAQQLGLPLEKVNRYIATPAPQAAQDKKALEAAIVSTLTGAMRTDEQESFSDAVAPEIGVFPFGLPGTQEDLQWGAQPHGHYFVLGGLNHGSMEPYQKFTVTFMGRRRYFWSDQVGVCRVRLPQVRPGRSESLTIAAGLDGRQYVRDFNIAGRAPEGSQLFSYIKDEYDFQFAARQLKGLLSKSAVAADDSLIDQLSEKERSLYDEASQIRTEAEAFWNNTNDKNDQLKIKLRDSARAFKEKYAAYTSVRLQRELMFQSRRRAERENRSPRDEKGNVRFVLDPKAAAKQQASELLDAFSDATQRAFKTARWDETENLLKGWRRQIEASVALFEEGVRWRGYTLSGDGHYASLLYGWASTVGDAQGVREAIRLLQEERKQFAEPDNKHWVARAKQDQANHLQTLARAIVQETGDARQATDLWLRAEKIEKELGEPVYRPDITTRTLYPDQDQRVPLANLERVRPGWWPSSE